MYHNNGTVFTGEFNFNIVDPGNTYFAAAKGFTTDKHGCSGFIFHQDIHRVWVNIGDGVIRYKMIFNAAFGCDSERIPDTFVICMETK